jgi:hypothetical protein
VFNRHVRRSATALALLTLVAVTACGGNGKKEQSATTAAKPASPPPVQPTTTEAAKPAPSKPKQHHGTKPSSSTAPLQVSAPYKCGGKPLRAISADGPVKVQPAIVKPGQSFTVTVTDRSAKVADVTLAGVAPQPILAHGQSSGGVLAARIKMPSYATCGNKLLEVEGDVSAEAYVGVGDAGH